MSVRRTALALSILALGLVVDASAARPPQAQIAYEVFLNGEFDHMAIGIAEPVTYCRGEGTNIVTVRAVDTSGNASAFSNQITFC